MRVFVRVHMSAGVPACSCVWTQEFSHLSATTTLCHRAARVNAEREKGGGGAWGGGGDGGGRTRERGVEGMRERGNDKSRNLDGMLDAGTR